MISLTDLNTPTTLSFTDNRPYGIVTNINYGKDVDFEYTTNTFDTHHSVVIEEIIGGASANVRIEYNTDDPSIIPQIAGFPPGVTRTTVDTKTTYFGIDSIDDYEVVKAAEITIDNEYFGAFGYSVAIIWDTPTQVNNQIRWQINQRRYNAVLPTVSTLSCEGLLQATGQVRLEASFETPAANIDKAVWAPTDENVDYVTSDADVELTAKPVMLVVPFAQDYWIVKIIIDDIVEATNISCSSIPSGSTFNFDTDTATIVSQSVADINTMLDNITVTTTDNLGAFVLTFDAFTNDDGSTTPSVFQQIYRTTITYNHIYILNNSTTRQLDIPDNELYSTDDYITNIFASNTPVLVDQDQGYEYQVSLTSTAPLINRTNTGTISEINTWLETFTFDLDANKLFEEVADHPITVNLGAYPTRPYAYANFIRVDAYTSNTNLTDGKWENGALFMRPFDAFDVTLTPRSNIDLSGDFTIDFWWGGQIQNFYDEIWTMQQIPGLEIQFDVSYNVGLDVSERLRRIDLIIDGTTRSLNVALRLTETEAKEGWHYFAVQRSGTEYHVIFNDTVIEVYDHESTVDHSLTASTAYDIIQTPAGNDPGSSARIAIHDIRWSNTTRYSTTLEEDDTITVPTSEFTVDSNTVFLTLCNAAYSESFDIDFDATRVDDSKTLLDGSFTVEKE